ncbi:MAG: hypothetical protein ABSH45_15205, partial [Bryobacteraceae bacterium]
ISGGGRPQPFRHLPTEPQSGAAIEGRSGTSIRQRISLPQSAWLLSEAGQALAAARVLGERKQGVDHVLL